MDEQGSARPGAGDADPASDDPLQRDAEELRRLIDAGASTPEELRALAERIRAHKALEQSRWRSDVKPELMAAKKWRYRQVADPVDAGDEQHEVRRNLKVGAGLLGGALLLLLLATQSGPAFVLLPLFGVLGYAYWQGRGAGDRGPGGPAEPLG